MSTSRQIARSKQRAQGEVESSRAVLFHSFASEALRAARRPGYPPRRWPARADSWTLTRLVDDRAAPVRRVPPSREVGRRRAIAHVARQRPRGAIGPSLAAVTRPADSRVIRGSKPGPLPGSEALMRYGFGTLGFTSSFLTPCARDMRKAPTRSGRCFDVRGLSRAPGHLCWRSAPSRAPRDSGWSCASRRPLGLALCDGDSALCVDAGRRHRESAVTTVQSTSPEFLRI